MNAKLQLFLTDKGNFSNMRENEFVNDMKSNARKLGVSYGDSELKSWGENFKAMKEVLNDCKIPNDVYIGFEYLVPVGGRIDCVLFGCDKNKGKNMLHIELKQWSNNNVKEYYSGYSFEILNTGYRNERQMAHPCAQAEEYQSHLQNYIAALEDNGINLHGLAYCYNYEAGAENNVLCSESYKGAMRVCPLFCKNEKTELKSYLESLLCGGNGKQVYDCIANSEIRPTKQLKDAAKNMFDGENAEKEFSLVGNQLNAYNAIVGAIKNTNKESEKTVVIVKGGPGTGKSVIAMRLVSGLAKEGFDNVYYSTRSTSLLKGYTELLKKVSYRDSKGCNAIDLLKKNVMIKPAEYGENGIDALIVDEAHRIEKSANNMNDKDKSIQTHLSQTLAMIFCARVSVFFIDDYQSVKRQEIGTSAKIREAAENYNKAIMQANKEYLEKSFNKIDKKIEQKEAALQRAINNGDDEKIRKAQNALNSALREKECGEKWVKDAQPKISKVNILEFELPDQFRCNGSDNYLDWIDGVLYKDMGTPCVNRDEDSYEFGLFDNPNDLYAKIRSLDEYAVFADDYQKMQGDSFSYKQLNKECSKMKFNQRARLVAGWCWDWRDRSQGGELQENGDLPCEVVIGQDFAMPWETKLKPKGDFAYKYAKSADLWLNQNEGVNQIGCIHSSQGWETDYIGVIIGPDVKYDKENDCLRYNENGGNHDITHKYTSENDLLVKNTYRVLLTRGKKGCFVYACDEEVRKYLRRCMEKAD